MNIARSRFHILVMFVVLCAAVMLSIPAQAAPKASLVMDLRNGKVLYARSADRKLHPASLTKMMTLYLTFKAVRDGRLSLDQKVRVSRHAARQPASKLYLKAGQRVSIRSLIRATAIKSANDAAMVLAEAVGGSQKNFARQMTRQAQRLGMNNTRFKNPHGLTASGHYSTARDMAKLGRHLFFDFPQYYNIFKRRSDFAAGKRVWNTNRLLSTYSGADGIKTGYTRAAGYNLVATAHRGEKRILAVQFGATSSGDRARRVARLLDMGFSRAPGRVQKVRPRSTGGKKSTIVARAPVPLARPGGVPKTRLAAVADILGPAKAQAARAPVTSVRNAPRVAELPKRRPGAVVVPSRPVRAEPTIALISNGKFPVPLPRPVNLADAGAWAAEVGPFDSESDALVGLAELKLEGLGKNAQVSRSAIGRGPQAYAIRMPQASEVDATVVCGNLRRLAPDCRVHRVQR